MKIIRTASGTMELKLSVDELVKVAKEHGFSLVKDDGHDDRQAKLDKQFADLDWTLSKRANQAENMDGEQPWRCSACDYKGPSDDFISYGRCPGCGNPLNEIIKS